MRNMVIIGTFFLLIGVIVVGSYFYLKPHGQNQVEMFVEHERPLTIAKRDLEAGCDQYVVRYKIGEKIPDYIGCDVFGTDFRLHNILGKKLLLYFNIERCESCKAYYPLLQEWAKKYQDSLKVIIFYPEKAEESVLSAMSAAGITVVPFAQELVSAFQLKYSSNNYLVDETGLVKHYFSFDERDWKNIDSCIANFAQQGIVSVDNYTRDYLQKNETVPDLLGVVAENTETVLNIESLQGKPTVIYFSDQICRFCKAGYGLLESLQITFRDKINPVVILSGLRTPEAYTITREYYHKYGLEVPGIYQEEIEPTASYIEENGLYIPVYCAAELLYARWGVKNVPAILVLDKNAKVVFYAPIDSLQSDEMVVARGHVEKLLKKLLK